MQLRIGHVSTWVRLASGSNLVGGKVGAETAGELLAVGRGRARCDGGEMEIHTSSEAVVLSNPPLAGSAAASRW